MNSVTLFSLWLVVIASYSVNKGGAQSRRRYDKYVDQYSATKSRQSPHLEISYGGFQTYSRRTGLSIDSPPVAQDSYFSRRKEVDADKGKDYFEWNGHDTRPSTSTPRVHTTSRRSSYEHHEQYESRVDPYHRTSGGGDRRVHPGEESYFKRGQRTTTTRLPPGRRTPVFDIDTIVDRDALYGRYSPGDRQDLGIPLEEFTPRNATEEEKLHPFTLLFRPRGLHHSPCEQSSCYPATGNLLIGRGDRLTASSTCGLYKQERYCIVSHLEDRKKCFVCDSRPNYTNVARQSHRIDNIISRLGQRKKTWWQSENGVENVTIQLDLEAEFHFTHLIITFKTFRPSALLIERSFDFGRTWKVYRYFAYDCAESFPGVPTDPPRRIGEVICESRYSGVAPSTEGEVIFRVLPPSLHIPDPYSKDVMDLLKMTNLRINFTRLHTLGDNLLDQREEIKEKYYYAIYDMVVRGSCSCYGHASRCIPLDPLKTYPPEMVHGRCECTHHTKGHNCEQCEDFYNDLPWRPAYDREINACKRCNCNNHATRCHFDAAVFEATGNRSGGVCDDCEHHTMGRNCEQCQPYYYEDPQKDIRDPDVCLPCDCDPRGSLDDGICDSRNDAHHGLEAGRCYCKQYVEGRRCDRCKIGFWNFQQHNPNGCEACTCNSLGTASQGCNPYTGECTCKRYVTGRDCNQCISEHWGLSEDKDGCKACDCDPGGSFDNNCDVITGQCPCRPHVTGRRCDQPDQGFFAGVMDYFVYDAELAHGSDNSQVVVREPYSDRETSWTGLGFMRVYEGSELEFLIDNIVTSMEYDIVIRYEPQTPGPWEDVRVTLERSGPVDHTDRCANTIPQDDRKQVTLPSGSRYAVVFPPACLEQGKIYKVKIDFRRYDNQVETPSASVLIDSIVLVPRIEGIPFFQGSNLNEHRRQEFERFRCRQAFNSVSKSQIPDVCKKYLTSIGFYVYGSALECGCDLTGSHSTICDPLGGQCQCKSNVVGRRCDRCAPGTYGFGPNGCRACDCNSIGSLDNLCDGNSGQCTCRPNTYGRQCDECQPGFWKYPSCQRCECNGHADTCDPHNGQCIDCRGYTAGGRCERCEEGFYGDPRLGVNIPCRPCPCPGVAESGHSYATTCQLDARLQTVVCNCQEGYGGERCDRCANNYFGNPEVPGGKCEKCHCNNNIDIGHPGNCDPKTGECLRCLFNTEGFTCERCRSGYYGDAIHQLCTACVCNVLGTNDTLGPCDRHTGQCPCYPNVIGKSCDMCKPNHWKIASGRGCEGCNCDSYGSVSEQCNEFDGQCHCKSGFGGRQCDQCQANYWGDPNVQCFPCQCNREGSATLQCHQNNGTCACLSGIGGEKCDRCARGFTGDSPYCDACGECFDNWDLIIQELKDETLRLIEAAKKVKQTGATGVYTNEFNEMEKQLQRVREILANANITSGDIDNFQNLVDQLRINLTASADLLNAVDGELDTTTSRIYEANLQLDDIRQKSQQLKKNAEDLSNNATALQEANVEGALNITREARKRSQAAQEKVIATDDTLRNSEHQRKRTEGLITRAQQNFNQTFAENEATLNGINDRLSQLEDEIPDLNDKVCAGRGDPCDSLCGGAGCNKCGGISCDNGAITKAESALNLAKEADETLKEKEKLADELLNNVKQAKKDADEARDEAQKAYDKALAAKNRSEDARASVEDLLDRIDEFLDAGGASPASIRTVAEEVLKKAISLDPKEITNLARQINDTISSLTDIDKILDATAGDLSLAKGLKERADRAKERAEDVLRTAQQVVESLQEAQDAQDKAQEAIDKANRDIAAAELDITQMNSESAAAQQVANKSVDEVEALKDKLGDLKRKFVQNELDIKKASQEAAVAAHVAAQAEGDASGLEDKYKDAAAALNAKANATGTAKDQAEGLKNRANKLSIDAGGKLRELRDMEGEFDIHEKKLRDLSDLLNELNKRMDEYADDIDRRSEFHQNCQT